MNAISATKVTSRAVELRLAPRSSFKLAVCATLSLLITLATASVIGRATGAASLSPAVSGSTTLTASLR